MLMYSTPNYEFFNILYQLKVDVGMLNMNDCLAGILSISPLSEQLELIVVVQFIVLLVTPMYTNISSYRDYISIPL